MNMYPKILIVTPTYEGKDYCLEEFINNLEKIDYPNYDYFIIDNSANDWFIQKIKFLTGEHRAVHIPRGKNSREAITNSMNYAREVFLEGDYDYMLVLENDLFPDKNVVHRLLKHGKPVTGSIYMLGFERDNMTYRKAYNSFMQHQDNKTFIQEIQGLRPQTPCLFVLEMKEGAFVGTRLIRPEEFKDWYNTGLREVHGCGLGCTLIRRDIVQKFIFWTDNRFDNKHHDVYFYLDLQKAGIPVFVDTSTVIKHVPSDWNHVLDM